MGVGLEAGLAIDSMASELAILIDQADSAAFLGDADALAEALNGLAERLLKIRPFIPDKKNPLPSDWRELLKRWVFGIDVDKIGAKNMRIVEDAFMYRLVWALEAIRTRRVSLGWSPEINAGGGAAALETGVPQLMMALLIRAGLPSRRAAMAAINYGQTFFRSPAEMREWLASEEIVALTAREDWPTAETAALWRRFRDDVLGGGIQTWTETSWKRALELADGVPPPPAGLYRIEVGLDKAGTSWLATPDFRRVAPFKKTVRDVTPSLFVARLDGGTSIAEASRIGRGKATWPSANSQ